MESATRLRAVLHSPAHPSGIFMAFPHSVQDAYSLRCVPQVHGIVHDTVAFVKRIIYRELNAATDNPMVRCACIVCVYGVIGDNPMVSFACIVCVYGVITLW